MFKVNSSTSNFDNDPKAVGFDALKIMAKLVLPTIVIVLVTISAFSFWNAHSPTYSRTESPQFVDSLISTQIDRAETIRSLDILIIGDSSGLMDISPIILAQTLDRNVETLATIAYAGPRGIASILDRLSARNIQPRTIILAFHAAGLPKLQEWSSWTDRVVHGPPKPISEFNPLKGALGKMNDLVSSTVFMPLEGDYGSYYGSSKNFENFIRRNHGGAIDPRPRDQGSDGIVDKLDWCCSFEMSDIFRSELPILKTALDRFPTATIYILVSPLPNRWATQQGVSNRKKAIFELASSLGLKQSAVLNTPGYMPAIEFVNPTHLHESAIPRFTQLIANELINQRRR